MPDRDRAGSAEGLKGQGWEVAPPPAAPWLLSVGWRPSASGSDNLDKPGVWGRGGVGRRSLSCCPGPPWFPTCAHARPCGGPPCRLSVIHSLRHARRGTHSGTHRGTHGALEAASQSPLGKFFHRSGQSGDHFVFRAVCVWLADANCCELVVKQFINF